MELFLEFVLTITITFLVSFFLAKLLSSPSSSSNRDYDHNLKPSKDLIEKVITGHRKTEAESVKNVSEGEISTGFVAEGESKQQKILIQEISNASCGSCDVKIEGNEVLSEVDDDELLVEKLIKDGSVNCGGGAGDFEENMFVESTDNEKIAQIEMGLAKSEVFGTECYNEIGESNEDGDKACVIESEEILVGESEESEKVAKIETELSKNEVGVAKSEHIEILKSKCDDKIIDSNKNEEHGGGKGSGVFECEEILVGKSTDSEKIAKIETKLGENEVSVAKSEILKGKCDNESIEIEKNEEDDAQEVLFDEDDDWEGVERTELGCRFGAAVAFVGSKSNADQISSLDSNVKMQLYGLHKIATHGPCHESQPMALKISARGNWNAWKQFGNMTPEVAMERYVTLLWSNIPGCIQNDIGGDDKPFSGDAEECSKLVSDLRTWPRDELGAVDERNVNEPVPSPKGLDVVGSSIQTQLE